MNYNTSYPGTPSGYTGYNYPSHAQHQQPQPQAYDDMTSYAAPYGPYVDESQPRLPLPHGGLGVYDLSRSSGYLGYGETMSANKAHINRLFSGMVEPAGGAHSGYTPPRSPLPPFRQQAYGYAYPEAQSGSTYQHAVNAVNWYQRPPAPPQAVDAGYYQENDAHWPDTRTTVAHPGAHQASFESALDRQRSIMHDEEVREAHHRASFERPLYAQELTYGGTMRRRSAEPVAQDEYHDHPSYAKPPHRASMSMSMSRTADVSLGAPMYYGGPAAAEVQMVDNEPQVIAEGASAIPPPPPIEKSAFPLAKFATALVWETFLEAGSTKKSNVSARDTSPAHSRTSSKTRNDVSPLPKQIVSIVGRGSEGSASPATGFGAIGRERRPSRLSAANSSPNSEMSSPSSSMPSTPACASGPLRWLPSADGKMISDCGSEDEGSIHIGLGLGKEVYGAPVKLSPLQKQVISRQVHPAPPAVLAEQVENLLSATLISQQVLLLALYFVSQLPLDSPLYPPVRTASALRSTSAPFKLLLAAIVVANKHLDDNSFRNSTFAQVSKVPLPEVNALEYSLLAGLSFNVNVETDTWLDWLDDCREILHDDLSRDAYETLVIIDAIIDGVRGQQEVQASARFHQRHAASLSATPSSPVTPTDPHNVAHVYTAATLSPHSDGSSGDFGLDSAGPLECRPKYSRISYNGNPAYQVQDRFFGQMPAYRLPEPAFGYPIRMYHAHPAAYHGGVMVA